ncbi:MAG: hypothetical protein NVV59_19835 [Chitinophagaceae bacterium]|nr:hypothetical protein [Chitinophagaceae bacterium]
MWEPFLAMKDEVDFVVIWGAIDENPWHPFPQVSFADYKSPYKLLDDVQPDRILFFNINAFTHIGLNLAAKNRGIPTYIMHHAIFHSDLIERNREKEKEGVESKAEGSVNPNTVQFYLSALRPKNILQVRKYLWFMWLRRRRERTLALEKCVFDGRLPTRYINLSPHNAILNIKVDHIKKLDKFIFIGHPFFDSILQSLNNQVGKVALKEDPYYLLIDFPNDENVVIFRKMGAERKRKFYQNLSTLARKKGRRLKIKLHPRGYFSEHNYQDDNIDLIREADMAALIHHADKVLSFFSTLIVPAIYHKGYCHIIYTGDDRKFQDELVELGVATKLDAYDFDESDLEKGLEVNKESENFRIFIERYLYYTDGKASQRLKELLAGQ